MKINLADLKKKAESATLGDWRQCKSELGDNYEISIDGRVRKKSPNKLLKITIDKQTKYGRVTLNLRGKSKTYGVHRLVLTAFIGPCPSLHEAAHLNGIRHDNRLENLKWVTRKENHSHKNQHGTAQTGEKHGRHKLNASQVKEIREAKDKSSYELAEIFGVNASTIRSILKRKLWSHIL